MRDNSSLALIDRICTIYEAAKNEDVEFAAEVMRVIRAVAVNGRVTLLSDGPTAKLLASELPDDPLLWKFVDMADDSVPDSGKTMREL
jgi:hypothetical protein